MRRDGEQVASGELANLADIAEARTHDYRLVAESLEVIVDLGYGLHAGVVGTLVVLTGVFFVPVEDASDEGRDQRDAGFGAGDGLVNAEEQREITVDAFLFKLLGGTDAFPCGGDLDEDALLRNALIGVKADDVVRHLYSACGVVGQACVDFGGYTAGNNRENLLSEGDGHVLEGLLGDGLVGGVFTQLLLGFLQDAVDDGLILRHLRGGGYQGRIGGRILRFHLLNRFDVTGIGNHRGHGAQLLQQSLRHLSSLPLPAPIIRHRRTEWNGAREDFVYSFVRIFAAAFSGLDAGAVRMAAK